MPTQYTPKLGLALPTTGELDGTWGTAVNNEITSLTEEAIAGLVTINSWTANSHTLVTANGSSAEARNAILVLTDTTPSLTGAGELITPDASKIYVVVNNTGQTITVKTAAGTGVAVGNGTTATVYSDGTNIEQVSEAFPDGTANQTLRYDSEGAIEATSDVTIDGSGNLSVSGDISVTGTVDGRDIAADGSLLDTAIQPGDDVSELNNDSGYISGNETITLTGDATGSGTTSITVTVVDDSHNHIISNVDGLQSALDGKATSAQGALADTAVQPGDNVSDLTNDAGYLDATTGVEPGDNVSVLTNDAGYLDGTTGVEPGDNVSVLTNDAGYLDGTTGVEPGDNADTLGSGGAPDGAVLTANGSGAAAWEANAVDSGLSVTTISSNTTAVAGFHYHIDTSGVTLTLPASPAEGDQVGVSVDNFTDCVVGRNGEIVADEASDYALENENSYTQFRYVSATEGWTIVSFATNAEPASGGAVVNLVADGAITVGDPVALNSDGTAASVGETTTTRAVTELTSLDVGNDTRSLVSCAYNPVTKQFLAIVEDGLSCLGYVGDYANGDITWSASTTLAFRSDNYGVHWDPNSEEFFVVYRDLDDSSDVKVVVITVSGTTPSLGTPVEVSTNGALSGKVAAAYHEVLGIWCVMWIASVGRTQVATFGISGTSVTDYGEIQVSSLSNIDVNTIVYDPNEQVFVVCFWDGGTDDIDAAVVTPDSSTFAPAVGTVTPIDNTNANVQDLVAVYDKNNEYVLLFAFDDGTAGSEIYALTIDGAAETISVTRTTDDATIDFNEGRAYWDSLGNIAVAIGGDASGTPTNEVIANFGDLSGTPAGTWVNDGSIDTGVVSATNRSGSAFFVEEEAVGFFFVLDDAFTTVLAFEIDSGVTTTNAANYFGIAQKTVADGEAVTVSTYGAIDNVNFSGLTAGDVQWINADGTLSTTATDYPVVGVAIDANSIRLAGGQAMGNTQFYGSISEEVYSLPAGDAVVDLRAGNGTVITYTPTDDTTFINELLSGETVTIQIDNSGSHTVAWPAGIQWIGGAAPTLESTGVNIVTLWQVDDTLYGGLVGNAA